MLLLFEHSRMFRTMLQVADLDLSIVLDMARPGMGRLRRRNPATVQPTLTALGHADERLAHARQCTHNRGPQTDQRGHAHAHAHVPVTAPGLEGAGEALREAGVSPQREGTPTA
jgi:hypothetical protein